MGKALKSDDARKNRQYQGQKCIIGLDQSYKRKHKGSKISDFKIYPNPNLLQMK